MDKVELSCTSAYTSNRIRLRSTTDADSREPKKRGAKKGHQAYQRLLPTRVGKVIRVLPRRNCPKHKGEPLLIGDHRRSTRSSISISPRVSVARQSPSMSARKATATTAINTMIHGGLNSLVDSYLGMPFKYGSFTNVLSFVFLTASSYK
jgi:hypothetical protein